MLLFARYRGPCQGVFTNFLSLFVQSTDSMGDRKSVEGGALSHHRLNIGSSVTFGDRRSTIRRVGTATTELSTQQSGEGAGTEDGEEEPAQVAVSMLSQQTSYNRPCKP